MSMIGEFQRITSWQLDDLLERARYDPEAFDHYLYPEERRFDPPDPKLSVGKGWHALHFMLNGDPCKITCVAGRAVCGGKEVGAVLSYSPVSYMKPAEVKEVSEALQVITEAEFKSRFHPEAFQSAEIYPSGTWSDASSLPWLWQTFEALRHFYGDGAQCGDALLFRLT